MSKFEIILIIIACAIPIISLLMVLPKKFKNKKKEVEKPTKTQEELKKEEQKAEEVKPKEVKKEEKKNLSFDNDVSTDEFKSYLDLKKDITKPKRIELPEGFKDMTSPYRPRRIRKEKKPENIVEEIQSLSPELKALIFSGALDRKSFDK